MKKMRIIIAVLSLSLFCVTSGVAFDFGALLGSGVKGSRTHDREGEDICETTSDFRHMENFSAWLRTPLNKKGNVTLSAQGSFNYEFLCRQYQTGKRFLEKNTTDTYYWNYSLYEASDYWDYTADLDLLKITYMEKPAPDENLTISVGRFLYCDTTNVIFTQNCDGMLVQYFSPKVQTSFYAGYTGFLNQKNVSILTQNDGYYGKDVYIVHSEDHTDDRWYKKLYDWADPYFASAFAVSFPYLFCNQTLGFEINSFFGSRGPSEVEPGSDNNRYYLTTNLSGPLDKSLTYSVATTFFTQDFKKLGLLSQFNLSYYFNYKNASLTLSSVFATGESKHVSRFQAFTSNSSSYAHITGADLLAGDNGEYSGMVKMGLSGSIKPVSTFYIVAGADLVNRCAHNLVRYYGWQWYGSAQLQCTSDCQIALTGYSFYGKEVYNDSAGVSLTLTLAF